MGVSLYLVLNNKLLRPVKRLRLLLLIVIFLIYLLLGSYIFILINLPIELEERKEIVNHVEWFRSKHKCISENDLNDFINLIVDASNNGIVFVENSTEYTQNWTYGGETLFFVFTLLATIGYGYAAPLTQNGKLFCIFYIIIGVPLTMLLLTLIVDRLEFKLTKNLTENNNLAYRNSKKYLAKEYYTISNSETRQNRRFYKSKNIYFQCFKIGSILVIFIYLIPAFVMSNYTESNWSFLDAFYYCYISVTTVGFGDLVPGENQVGYNRNLYRFLMTIYLMFGIIVNMLFLNLFIRLPLITKIHDSWLKLRRRRLFQVVENEIDDDKHSEEIIHDSEKSSRTNSANISLRNSPNFMNNQQINDTSEIDKINYSTNNNNITTRHLTSNATSSKTKNV